MIVLDTTVLVYAKGAEHPLRDPCRDLVAAIADERIAATTTAEVCQMLAGSGFVGHVVLEVSTSSARSANERESMLAESLQFARTHLLR